MNKQEYEQKQRECWEEFLRANPSHNKSVFARKVFAFAFDRAYALGKQGKDADTVISGWVVRDSDGDLFFYNDKPRREKAVWDEPQYWIGETYTELDPSLFPDLTWFDEPQEVEIILKRKNLMVGR